MSTITTAAGLDALPIGSVVRSSAGTIGCRYDERRGLVFGDDRCFPWTDHLAFPLTVLYRPDCEPERTEAQIKAEALRDAAGEIAGMVRINCELRHDGSTDPLMAAYVEGVGDAYALISELARLEGEARP